MALAALSMQLFAVSAIVTNQSHLFFMDSKANITIPAVRDMPAVIALHIRTVTSSVLKQDNLLFIYQGIINSS